MTVLDELARWEGVAQHMYVCTAGRVTTAIGHMMPTAQAAKLLPWKRPDGTLASPAEVESGYHAVLRVGPGRKTSAYAPACDLRISRADVNEITQRRLDGYFIPALRRMFANWEFLPEPAQRVLTDMVWNLGPTGLGKFKRLSDAVEAGDWRRASAACSVRTSRPERNEWRAATFASLLPRGDA